MDDSEVIERILSVMGDAEATTYCRALAARFREALKKANPDLSDAQMAAYDVAFESELDALKGVAAKARLEALQTGLTAEDLAIVGPIADGPQGAAIIRTIRKLSGVLNLATQEAIRSAGVEIHKRSAEAAFEAA